MKRILFCTLAVLLASTAFAHQLTPSEALSRLQLGSVSPSKSNSGMALSELSSFQLTYSSRKDGKATYYVFDNPTKTGFIVVSGDDCMPALLGEVEGSAFNLDSIPDGMKWLLSEYDKVISEYIAEGKTYTATSIADKEAISPLLGNLKWGQNNPFYIYCPSYNDNHTPTGCLATAMAQIMKCFNYPEKGIGSNTYTFDFARAKGDTVKTTATSNFYEHTYDWENMLDRYLTGRYTEDQGNAVAQLMYDCGVAVNMKYGYNGSGAEEVNAAWAFENNFDYPSAHISYRQFYTNDDWEELVYKELSEGRPLLYSGYSSTSGGHAFVCDGFKDGKFRINWGWTGSNNGYFLLTGTSSEIALYPSKAYGSFTSHQSAITGLQPSIKGKLDYLRMATDTYTAGKLDTLTFEQTDTTTLTSNEDFLCLDGGFWNVSNTMQVFDVGMKLSNDIATYYISAVEKDSIESFYGYSRYWVDITSVLKNGTYTVTPIYKDLSQGDTEWKEMLIRSDITRPTITVNKTIIVGDVNGDSSVNISDVNAIISIICGTATKETYPAADVNGDGSVNISDVNAVISIICGNN